MKNIGSVKEDLNNEKRISITPDIIKKFTDLNFSIFIEKNYGEHLGIADEEYVNKGASLNSNAKEVLEKTEIILKVNCPSSDEIDLIREKVLIFFLISLKISFSLIIGSNWPIKIDFSFIKLISLLEGQLTFKIISVFSKTSFAELLKLTPLFIYSSSDIPKCSP